MVLQPILLGEPMNKFVNEISGSSVVMTSATLRSTLVTCGHFAPLRDDIKKTAHLQFNKNDLKNAFEVLDGLIEANRKRLEFNMVSRQAGGYMTKDAAAEYKNQILDSQYHVFNLLTYQENDKYALTIAPLGYDALHVILFAESATVHEF